MSLNRVHLGDLRLKNNTGVNYPVCSAEDHLLDLNKSLWIITSDMNKATCKNCKKAFSRRYP